jgi:hypothetical protein
VHESGIGTSRQFAATQHFGRVRRHSGHAANPAARWSDANDPYVWSDRASQCMVRPCVARGFRRSGGCAVLHQCIRPVIGACCAPGHHGYQRASDLISGQASTGPFGSPVFASAGKTDPPSRLILSQISAGNGGMGYVIDRSSSRAVPLFVPVPSSRPVLARERRAQGAVKAGRRADLASCLGVARPRLDGSEHGATLKPVGTPSHRA